jgi:general secretion pathway protein H
VEHLRAKLAYPRAFSGKNACKSSWILGFTLVELLVVVVVIGIAMSVALSNVFVSDEERLRQETARLARVVEQTRDRAAFSGYPIAMKLSADGIAFMERDPSSVAPRWREAESAGLAPQAWRQGIRASLVDSAGAPLANPVTFMPTGVGAPFRLLVSLDTHTRIIEGDALGNVRVTEAR